MYILELNNFYNFKYHKIEFPDFGLCLLDGPSGVGKTTIMNAIGFILYEQHSKTECKPKSNTKQIISVKLTSTKINDSYIIYRQMNPNLHEYSDSNGKLIDKVAQEHIINKFGSYDRWLSSTFLTHDELHFLTLSNDEKLKILGEICDLNNDKYEKYIDYIVNEIKKNENILRDIESYKKNIIITYTNIYNSMNEEDINTTLWTEDEIKNIISEYNLSPDINNWMFEIRKWENNARNNLLKMKEDEIIKKNNYDFIKNMNDKLNSDIAILKIKLLNINVVKEDIDKCAEKIKSLNNEILEIKSNKLLEEKKYYEIILSEMTCYYPKYTISQLKIWEEYKGIDIKNEIFLLEQAKYFIYDSQIYQKRSNLEKLYLSENNKLNSIEIDKNIDFNTISERINILKYDIINYTNSLSCPSCDSKLHFNSGKLFLVDNSNRLNLHQMNEILNNLIVEEDKWKNINIIKNDIMKIEKELSNVPIMVLNNKNKYVDIGLLAIENKLNKYKSINIPISDNGENINVENEINNYVKYQEKLNIEKKLEAIISDVKTNNIIESNKKDINILLLEIKKLQVDYDIKLKLFNDKANINNEILNYEKQIKELPIYYPEKLIELDSCLNYVTNTVSLRLCQFDLQKKLRDMYILKQNLEIYEIEWNKKNELIQGLYKLKITIHNAHHHILETNLEKINRKTNKILLDIFVKPITVRLSTLKQLKIDKSIKPSINLQIIYNGIEYTSIKSLSTGEKSRIRMALLFAFAKISKSPFLLLDESLTTLDHNSKEHVIDLIRKVFLKNDISKVIKRKWLILIVNHEANHANYDSVYNIH